MHGVVRGGDRGGRHQRPVLPEEFRRLDAAEPPHLVDEELANLRLAVVHHGRAAEHGVPAAARLPVVVHGERERIGVRDALPVHAERRDARPDRSGRVDRVVGARDDVEVVAGNLRIDGRIRRARGAEVAGAVLEIVTQLPPREAHHLERVLVWVELGDLRHGDGAGAERGVRGERGGGREIGTRGPALHLEHEVDERRVLHARRVGAPGGGRRADGVGHVSHRGVVSGARRLQHLLALGAAHHRNELAALGGHAVAVALSDQREVGDAHARGPVARLHEQGAVDRRVGHLAVRVAVDDEVDAGHVLRDLRRDVLAPHAREHGVVARRPAQSRVQEQHHGIHAGALHLVDGSANLGDHVPDLDTAAKIVAIPEVGPRRGGADDPDAHATALHDAGRLERARPVGLVDVGGEEREPRLPGGHAQRAEPVVELVVADGRRVVPHGVHRRDHGMRGLRADARGHVRERIALEEVAGVDEQHGPG